MYFVYNFEQRCCIFVLKGAMLNMEDTKFKVNEIIMYGNTGVCKISDIRMDSFADSPEQLYYALSPIYDLNSTIFVPVNSDKVRIRSLLSRQEVLDLIRIIPEIETFWVENDNQRKNVFSQMMKECEHRDLIKLIKSLYQKREEKKEQGRKFFISDEKILTMAEKLLFQEFALVLGIEVEEVLDFITDYLNEYCDGQAAFSS